MSTIRLLLKYIRNGNSALVRITARRIGISFLIPSPNCIPLGDKKVLFQLPNGEKVWLADEDFEDEKGIPVLTVSDLLKLCEFTSEQRE